jgi:pyridoxal phosphate enzyme (YggS family)
MFNPTAYKNIQNFCQEKHVQMLAVSKMRSIEELKDLYASGHRIFGENRVQELLSKKDALPNDIEWHLIGHLQSNKVKFIAPFVRLIHSVDSLDLLQEIQIQAKKNDRIIDCLLQVHIAQENSKFGIPKEEILAFVSMLPFNNYPNIRIVGLMGMASFVENDKQIAEEFAALNKIYKTLKNNIFKNFEYFNTLSMGMSGDYELAIAEGSTLVRVGSKLFI